MSTKLCLNRSASNLIFIESKRVIALKFVEPSVSPELWGRRREAAFSLWPGIIGQPVTYRVPMVSSMLQSYPELWLARLDMVAGRGSLIWRFRPATAGADPAAAPRDAPPLAPAQDHPAAAQALAPVDGVRALLAH